MKKGFTLVELLAVLVVLSIAVAIAATSYAKISKEQKVTACNNLKKQIENLAVEYVIDTNGFYNDPDNTRWVTLSMLINNGYIEEEDLVNPVDNTSCDSGWSCNTNNYVYDSPINFVVVKYDKGKYMSTFEYNENKGIICE